MLFDRVLSRSLSRSLSLSLSFFLSLIVYLSCTIPFLSHLGRVKLKPMELGQSVLSVRFADDENDYYCVGACDVKPDEDEVGLEGKVFVREDRFLFFFLLLCLFFFFFGLSVYFHSFLFIPYFSVPPLLTSQQPLFLPKFYISLYFSFFIFCHSSLSLSLFLSFFLLSRKRGALWCSRQQVVSLCWKEKHRSR